MRLIDADALESTIQEQTGKCMIKIFEPSVNLILQDIRNAPTVDAEPVAHIKELEEENKALKLLIEWAEECDFGYDNFPEEYERYKDEIEGMGYTEGMIHIAKRVYQRKSKTDGGADDECKKV